MSDDPQKATILVVDDEEDVRELLEESLEDSYRVLTAPSGPDALEILGEQRVDVLVTDQRMPKMSGVQLVGRARDLDRDLISILLTAYTDPRDLIDAINTGGVYRFISKPWDLDDLRLTLRNAVEHRQLREKESRLSQELSRRYAALELLYDVAGQASLTRSGLAVIDLVIERLDQVVEFDAAVSLLLDRGSADASGELSGRIIVRTSPRIAHDEMVRLRDQAIERLVSMSGLAVEESRLTMRAIGHSAADAGGREMLSHLFIPLRDEAGTIGIMALASGQERAYEAEHADLLDILANRTVESVRTIARSAVSERRRIENAVASMADGVLMTDAAGEVAVANPAVRELLGLPDGSDITADLLKQRLGFYPFELVRGWGEQQEVLNEEVRVGERTLHSIISQVRGTGGVFDGVVVVLRDVTAQRQLEARKEEFVSIVTHELRTPIAGVGGAMDLLIGGYAGDLSEKQLHFLRMAKDSTERLNRIVDDLLDLSKFAQGKMTLDLQPASLGQVCRDTVEKFTPGAIERKVNLSLALPDHNVMAELDPFRFGQVLANLLSNALKFAAEGGRITVSLARSELLPDMAICSVSNDGPEIERDDLEAIFEKFSQGRSAHRTSVKGTGLGLAICRSIVEAHGGRIWVESGRGHGTHFFLALPDKPPEEGASAPLRARVRPRTIALGATLPELAALKCALLDLGAEAAMASNADEAMALSQESPASLILIDPRGLEPGADALVDVLSHDVATRGATVAVLGEEAVAGLTMVNAPAPRAELRAELRELLREHLQQPRGNVLLVEPDEGLRRVWREVLEQSSYRVVEAADLAGAASALAQSTSSFDVVVSEAYLPDGSAFHLPQQLVGRRLSDESQVLLTAADAEVDDRVRALREGAADFLPQPFDPAELLARIEASLRRRDRTAASSPTTRLPGSSLIEVETNRRLRAGEPLGLCYLDLDNLKAYNDSYGYAKADSVVSQTGDVMRQVVAEHGEAEDFIGHIAGDDFVVVSTPDRVEALSQAILDAFDRIIPLYYTREDRERGYIEAEDRFGQQRRFPIMGLSASVLIIPEGADTSYGELARLAADTKKRAKAIEGSAVVVERLEKGA